MTSLLIKHANEIAEAMAKSLGDEEFTKLFKAASVEKTAGPAFEAFKKNVDAAVEAGTDLEQVYSKHVGALSQEENEEPGVLTSAREYMAEKAHGKQPGMVMPKADDPCMSADCMEQMPADDKEVVATDFALDHLAKIADALDEHGFNKLANIIDTAMQDIVSKKEAAAKDRPPKKWWDKIKKETKANKKYKEFSDERIDKVVGGIWHDFSDKEKAKIRREYA